LWCFLSAWIILASFLFRRSASSIGGKRARLLWAEQARAAWNMPLRWLQHAFHYIEISDATIRVDDEDKDSGHS